MAYVPTTQEVVPVPVVTSTIVLAQNLSRLGWYLECQSGLVDWWVTFDAVAAAENVGVNRSGRARLHSEEIFPTLAGTNAFVEPVRIFVKGPAGVATVDFWVLENE